MTGREVRDLLLEKGFVLADIANKLNISAQTLNSRLNAKYFRAEYIIEIENLLDISFKSDEKTTADSTLLSLIESQQRTIETLSRTIETLTQKTN